MRVLLKIESQWRELAIDNNQTIEITTTHDNGENPSQMVDEYSYILSVSRNKQNNSIFARFYRMDSIRVVGEYDPTKKMEIRIIGNDGSLLLSGYAVVNEIDNDNYHLSVVGKRSAIIDMLINSGWDATNTNPEYTVFTDPVSVFLNRRLIGDSWIVSPENIPYHIGRVLGQGQTLANLYGITNQSNAEAVSILGFAPTIQGEPFGIDASKWLTAMQTEEGQAIKGLNIAPVLSHTEAEKYQGEQPLSEATMAQYRSYTQQPFIYINKLWQLIQINCHQATGYDMVLDSRFFNEGNILYRDVIYTLPQLTSEATKEITISNKNGTNSAETGSGVSINDITLQQPVRPVSFTGFNVATDNTDTIVRGNIAVNISVNRPAQTITNLGNIGLRNDAFTLGLQVVADGATMNKYCFVVLPDDYEGSETLAMYKAMTKPEWQILEQQGYTPKIARQTTAVNQGGTITANLSFAFHLSGNASNVAVTTGLLQTNTSPFVVGALVGDWSNTIHGRVGHIYQRIAMSVTAEKNQRSNSTLTLGRLFGDIKPIAPLLQYSKMMRLSWLVDDTNKTITIKRTRDHLSDCRNSISDITKYVDRTEQTIKPLSWDAHDVLLNYAPNELTDYEERHGQPYGSKRIITNNKTTKETNELLCNSEFDTISAPIMATEKAYNRIAYEKNNLSARPIANNPMILNHIQGKSANASGSFFIRQINSSWQLGLSMVEYSTTGISAYIGITDDTIEEEEANIFCYHDLRQGDNNKILKLPINGTFPMIDISTCGDFLAIQFAEAKESYTTKKYPNDMIYLYEQEWGRYIEEVYNPNNKTITTGARLPRKVWQQLRGNPLVVYGYQLFYVLKIEGWSEQTTFCKLTMRKVSDLQNLIS